MIELISNKKILEENYEIREYYTEKGNVRGLVVNDCVQSLLYIDEDKKNEIAFDYFKLYDIPILLNPNGKDLLMLGGGALAYPHHYLNSYKDKNIDIVEIDEKCIKYAKQYFYLDKLINQEKERINIVIDDAIKFLSYNNKKYDYILIDLFNGKEPVTKIYEENSIQNLKRTLKDNGVIIINYIINDNDYIKDINRITTIANNYKIITNKYVFDLNSKIGNVLIILSNNEISIPKTIDFVDVTSNN